MSHRILVVDDEESIRSMLEEYLRGQGYRVVTAVDGDAGIAAFKRQRMHLAIIDFLLPRKNGFAVAEAIRGDKDSSKMPIVMMSGVFKNPKTAVEAREKYQVVEFLSKPMDLATLSRVLQKALANIPADAEDPPPVEPPKPKAEPAPQPRPPIAAPSVSAMPSPAPSGTGLPAPSVSASRSAELRAVPASSVSRADASVPPPRGLSFFGGSKSAPPAPASRPHAPAAAAPSPRPGLVASAEVRDGVFRGRPFPELPEEGAVERFPVALLLSIIRYDGVTGMLDMTDQATHRRIYIIHGNPTFMQSNAEGENVGALLLRRGRITEPDFDRCLRYMKDKGRTLQQSLLELRLVSEHDLATAYKLLAGQLLPLALGMGSGTFRWRETDAFVGRVPEGKFEPISVLFDGIKRHVHPPQILKFFSGREDAALVRTTEFDKLMPFFRRAFSANNVAARIDGSSSYRSITRTLAGEVAAVIPQLFAMTTSGMCVLQEGDEDLAMAAAVNAAAAEVEFLGQSDGEDLELMLEDDDGPAGSDGSEGKRARGMVERFHAEIMSQDFFRIFGVDRGADAAKVKAAYFELAKKWHTDAFGGLDLGASRRQLDEIFARITEAYETITDKSKREEYIVYLDRKAKGLPTDVNEILRGEQLFDQATAMIRRRDFAGASPVLDEAVRLNPDPLYFATLGWVTFNLDPSSQQRLTEAVQLLRKATQEQENLPVAYQYLGQIAFTRGQAGEAKKWFARCLEWEPNNIEAARGIRMVNQRAEAGPVSGAQGPKSGILGKLLTKK